MLKRFSMNFQSFSIMFMDVQRCLSLFSNYLYIDPNNFSSCSTESHRISLNWVFSCMDVWRILSCSIMEFHVFSQMLVAVQELFDESSRVFIKQSLISKDAQRCLIDFFIWISIDYISHRIFKHVRTFVFELPFHWLQ